MKEKPLVIGIISSAREGSNSAVLVREALRGAAKQGMNTIEIYLPDCHLEFCTGCLSCMKSGRCRLSDGFNGLREQLYEADGIIWGSPTYAAAPNAIMKNLIDRLGMFEVSTSSLGGKYMAGIAAANSSRSAKKTAKGLSRFGIGGTFLRSYSSAYLGAGFRGGKKAQDDEKLLTEARELGAKVAKDIQIKKAYPIQGLFQRLLSSLFMKPVFGRYIKNNKDADAKALYESLHRRGLLT